MPKRTPAGSQKKERVGEIITRLARVYPKPRLELDFETPFQLLIATILAAQSTDVRINQVTPALFAKYPTPADFAKAKQEVMERDVKSTGFFRNKAKAVIACSQALVQRFGGEVPKTIEELVSLPGVGRKTANVVLGNAMGIAAGIVVDTHVTRVAARLGLTATDNAEKIEQDLMSAVPQKEWIKFANRLTLHGRRICVARKPKCRECALNDICPSAEEPEE
ncbi:MAG: endonuclease III [Thermoanaerobaculia bacterium]